MAILVMVFRKMMRNKLLTINMAIACILFIALLASVPLYTDGVLQNLLIEELESFQIERNIFPGSVTVRSDYGFYTGGPSAHKRVFNRVDDYLNNIFIENLELPIKDDLTFHQTGSWHIEEDLRTREIPDRDFFFRLTNITGLPERIEITEGRLPSENLTNGKHEVLISEEIMFMRHISVGDEFVIEYLENDIKITVHIVVVGAFKPLMQSELLYLFSDISGQNVNIFMHDNLFNRLAFENFNINETIWYFAIDYHAIDIHNIYHVLNTSRQMTDWIRERGFSTIMPLTNLLPRYEQYREELIPLLFSLYAPIIIMLFFYLFMVSSMVVAKQKNEISVLKSRGAGRIQIMYVYLIEAFIFGLTGLILGPFLGIMLTRVLGSTAGFMEFVNRTALMIEMNLVTYIYAASGALLSIVAIIVPVYSATTSDIIEQKKKTSRYAGLPIWKKYFLDVLVLAISFYGLYQFNLMKQDLILVSDLRLSIDPLLFVISTLFILGTGLMFIRLLPLIFEIIFKIGKKYWSLTMYSTLIQVARSIHTYQFLMIFIIMTVATAIFSATAARTINENAHDRIRYQGGADHILMSQWRVEGLQIAAPPAQGQPTGPGEQDEQTLPQDVRYIEPPFERYKELAGVQTATRVLNSVGRLHHSAGSETVRVMGIEPRNFGLTAWYPGRLLPYHWFHYLNEMSRSQSMVLISRSLAESANLKQWDIFSMNWDPNGRAEFMVAGVIDFWPTWNPHHELDIPNNRFDSLIVANIDYLQAHAPLRPYEVWLDMKPYASTQELYKDIIANGIRLERISDTSQQLVQVLREPVQMGINGSLTLVFIISIAIIIFGFMLFWMLAVNSRLLQSGVMMAIGVRLKELVTMTLWELILTSVVPMIFGIIIGGIASTLFIPVLQISFSAVEQVPPFRAVSFQSDYVNIYLILGSLVILGLVTVSYMLSNLKIYSCIKLGED